MPDEGFDYCRAWGKPDRGDIDELVAFWLAEGALTDEAAARQRAGQVVLFARAPEGHVAGVCTAVPHTLPQLGQPLYYYRSFIGAKWRSTRLVYNLLKHARALLEDHARAHDWPCIGILLELENRRFGDRGRMPVWPRLDFTYVGKSPRGLELRVYYFPGARLK